jgi:DnaJ-class molecular chaperone
MDYYNRLGVNKSASPDEIKKAYKKLAMQHHPDRGGDNNTFSQINAAYDTLKDADKRFMYDREQNKPKVDFNSRAQQRRHKNPDILLSVKIDLRDVMTGKEILGRYTLNNGLNQTANIKIPPGVHNGDTLRFAGMGDNINPSMPRGDLYVKISIQPHKTFKRENNHLRIIKRCSILDLITGTTIKIETLLGSSVNLTIPKGLNPGTTLSLSGHGLPQINTNQIGHLYVQILGETPNITDIELLEKVQELKNGINTRTSSTS